MAWCLVLTIFAYVNYDRINLVKYESEVYCNQEIADTLAEEAIDKTLFQAQLDDIRKLMKADNHDREQFAAALESAAENIRQVLKDEEKSRTEPDRYSRTVPVSVDTGWKAKTVLPDPY